MEVCVEKKEIQLLTNRWSDMLFLRRSLTILHLSLFNGAKWLEINFYERKYNRYIFLWWDNFIIEYVLDWIKCCWISFNVYLHHNVSVWYSTCSIMELNILFKYFVILTIHKIKNILKLHSYKFYMCKTIRHISIGNIVPQKY